MLLEKTIKEFIKCETVEVCYMDSNDETIIPILEEMIKNSKNEDFNVYDYAYKISSKIIKRIC